jgi:serine/threonine protein phosphatase PrpC
MRSKEIAVIVKSWAHFRVKLAIKCSPHFGFNVFPVCIMRLWSLMGIVLLERYSRCLRQQQQQPSPSLHKFAAVTVLGFAPTIDVVNYVHRKRCGHHGTTAQFARFTNSLWTERWNTAGWHSDDPASMEVPYNSNFHWDYGCATLAGTDPDRPQKVNQDGSFYFHTNNSIGKPYSIIVFGVMDGHGLKGHELVQYLQEQLPVRITEYLHGVLQNPIDTLKNTTPASNDVQQERLDQFKQDLIKLGHADPTELFIQHPQEPRDMSSTRIQQAIVDAFLSVQYDASQNPSVPSSRSGTTCICCVLVDDQMSGDIILYTATVGDSKAVLISSKHNSEEVIWTVQSIADPITVNVVTERNRIVDCQGRIDTSGNVFYGPIGIAMTRSLGNTVLLRAGILPIPVVSMEKLSRKANTTTMYYICAGTDGVFDVVPNEQITKIIQESGERCHNNGLETKSSALNEIAVDICRQAKLAWLADLPIETKVDDMTFAMMKCSVGDKNAIH